MLPVIEIQLPAQDPSSGGNVPAFLAKLWKMVNNPDTGEIKLTSDSQCYIPKKILDLSGLSIRISKQINGIISDGQWQIKKIFNVLALENILVALTRKIGDGPCFLYIKFSWIGVWCYVNLQNTAISIE